MKVMPILTLTGASGTGKTTIARRLVEEIPSCRMLVSYTTRDPRENDIPGEYTYLTQAAFDRMRTNNEFEWTAPPMRGRDYGTTTKSLETAFADTENTWIMILVPETLSSLYMAAKRYDARTRIRSAFIQSPNLDMLRRRLQKGRCLSSEAVEIDIERCRDWEDQIQRLDIPFHIIPDENEIEPKYQAVLNVCGLHTAPSS